MKNILVIQFRTDQAGPHEQQCIDKRLPKGDRADYVSIFDESVEFDQPETLLKPYEKLILGGSGEIDLTHPNNPQVHHILDNLKPLMNYVLKNDFPTFGACFGHHLIGHFTGAKVARDQDQAETGFASIELTKEGRVDPLFEGIDDSFVAVVGHKDSVMGLPEGAVHLAKSEKSMMQCFKYKNNIYASQFHGELDDKDLMFRLDLYPEYKKFAESLEPVPTPQATKVLQNFLSM